MYAIQGPPKGHEFEAQMEGEVFSLFTSRVEGSDDSDDELDPYVGVQLGANNHTQVALIDSGAHKNCMSHAVFAKLTGTVLVKEEITFIGFSSETTTTLGYMNIPVVINGLNCSDKFYVLP